MVGNISRSNFRNLKLLSLLCFVLYFNKNFGTRLVDTGVEDDIYISGSCGHLQNS